MVTDIYGVPHLVFFIGIRDPSHLQRGQVPIGLFMSEESPMREGPGSSGPSTPPPTPARGALPLEHPIPSP